MSRRRLAARLALGALTVPTLAVTLARATGSTGDLGIVLSAFAPLAVVPYALAAVLAIALAARGRPRGLELASAALVGVMLVLHLAWLSPMVLGGAPEPASGADPITVLSTNVRIGNADVGAVVEAVRENGVEVLVVSEITGGFLRAVDAAGLPALLPYRAGRPGITTAGTMVFSTAPLSGVERVPTDFDSFAVTTSGLRILATHPAPPQLSDAWRREQPLLLRAAREHDVDAVVGDLNATLDHPGIRALVGAGWRDAVELTNGAFAATWPADGDHHLPFPVVQIDHVLVRDSYAVTAVETLTVPGTDHLAVLATLAAT